MKSFQTIQRVTVRAVPRASNPKYYEWETASICILVPEDERETGLIKARMELDKRHWTLIKIEGHDRLIEKLVREDGGEILAAYDQAQRGKIVFKIFPDGFHGEGKSRRMMVPARVTEQFIDKVVAQAGGQRIDTSGLAPGERTVDYLLGSYAFELKDLQEEAMEKGPHQERLAELFRPYARGETQVSIDPSILSKGDFHKYLDILGRPIQGHVRSAAGQIRATRERMGRRDMLGGLILLNTGFGTYPHDQFAAQVERFARKDSSEFSDVISISIWNNTNGFDTHVQYKISPEQTDTPEILAFQVAFGQCFMEMMTAMMTSEIPEDQDAAPMSRTVGFARSGIDFSWEAPKLPLPWEK